MKAILHIDSSPRTVLSGSRLLTRELVCSLTQASPDSTVVYRNLVAQPPAHVDEAWIAAAFTPPGLRTAEMQAVLEPSDALIDELLAADLIVIGVPMHNFGICSLLKCYLDQVVRAGRTFQFTAHGPRGLVAGKRVIVVMTRGSFYSGSPMAALDFQQPHLKALLGFLGIEDVTFISCDGLDLGNRDQALDEARRVIQTLVAELAEAQTPQLELTVAA